MWCWGSIESFTKYINGGVEGGKQSRGLAFQKRGWQIVQMGESFFLTAGSVILFGHLFVPSDSSNEGYNELRHVREPEGFWQ